MKNFWGSFLGAILGNLTVGILSTVIIIIVVAGLFSSTFSSASSSSEESINDKTILKISLDYTVNDRPYMDPFSGLAFGNFENNFQLGLNELLPVLEYAAKDDKIKGLYLDLGGLPSGMATLEEIRNALINFKASGKFIVAYSEYYTQKAYYIATVADEIYLNPQGQLDFIGLSASVEFYKKLLDKIGVKAEAIRPTGNRFKSAIEPYITDKMSDANRQQLTLILNTVWGSMLEAVSEKTGWNQDSLNAFANRYAISLPRHADSLNFVTGLKYSDEILDLFKSKLSLDTTKDVNFVRIETYYKKVEAKLRKKSDNIIAVVYASGAINRGKGYENVVGSDDFVEAIRSAREDKDVKAIVLRVNSPGGDALASDLIWREVDLAKKTKPVIVSMGNYAASGGYYIACAADTIVADHNTLTGSIGVFSLMLNTSELLTEKVGITFDTVKTNRYSDFPSTTRAISDPEKAIFQAHVDEIYQLFLSRVATGRRMSVADVDSIAQGRVWTGKDAIGIGLVDLIGGIDTAIAIAARKADITSYKLVDYPTDKNTFNKFLRDISSTVSVKQYLEANYGEMMELALRYEELKNMKGVQARMPFVMHIE